MAVYRQIHTSFWQDPFVLELTPEEKYFYIYLMTNTKTSACGIYELPKKVIELETGYNKETVDKLIQRFIEYNKILYSESTKEIILLNWLKYNNYKSTKTQCCIRKKVESSKNKDFEDIVLKQICPMDTPSIPHLYTIEGGTNQECTPIGEKEKEKEKENENEKDKNISFLISKKIQLEFNLVDQIGEGEYDKLKSRFLTAGVVKSNEDAETRLNSKIMEYDNWKSKGKGSPNQYADLITFIDNEIKNIKNMSGREKTQITQEKQYAPLEV
jgi:hypothetical protein